MLCLLAGLSACATTPGGETGDAQSEQQQSAVLFVERHAADATNGASHVGARFVQFVGIDPAALPDLLGTPIVPSGAAGCRAGRDTTVDTSGARAEARLLDIGPIDVRAGDRTLQLQPRRFPDLWNTVSGMIYGTDGDLPLGAWRFTAAGDAQSHVGAFDVEVRSPEDLTGVFVADQALGPGDTVAVGERGFAVRWARGERDDSVAVFFEGNTSDGASSVVCTARDEGALDVDATWAARIAAMARTGASVTVHRIRAHSFATTQLENAQVVFDLSLRGELRAE
jgi:hypothetical protein